MDEKDQDSNALAGELTPNNEKTLLRCTFEGCQEEKSFPTPSALK
jgi:hypothetical protein